MSLLNIRLSVWTKPGVNVTDRRLDDLMAGSYEDGRYNLEAEMILDGVRRLVAKAVGCQAKDVDVGFASERDPKYV